ncbi:D-inositol-3-phosphate glycosyltransferase [Actinopolyspora erythraea]|uniref:D-inositol-3-phosphate glycosyltransferase n=1 Tax=Actinopolyspora erythraea TaxID=414996 RepID=A0A099DB50_9ACTN|nr:D-inositol-3-phosphate glycosyltransferase [Actinopolyspora erythraea]ASU80336.1 D-inositol-3-phosphate glycosyltransferase [Actinopolyspora erythraea]KGI82585.1 D-inositol 3-phosphate glycosyltransferase [Actinopolyspora erythraea]
MTSSRLQTRPRRVAVFSLHTSPLEQPGTGDAGGMNVYIAQTATRMARLGTEVEIFTRATSSEVPPVAELAPGVTVRHIVAGPFEGLDKNDLPAQLCAFGAGALRVEARHQPGHYDIVHSHYWLSGQVGWLARERWGVPLVHTAHTLAKVKNASLAEGDEPEPRVRVVGEEQVVADADRLVANTDAEARELVSRYDADSEDVTVVPPGVDLERFTPGDAGAAREWLGIEPDARVLAFVGRVQPLKGPDVLLRSVAELLARHPELRDGTRVLLVGGPSGNGTERPEAMRRLAESLGITDVVRFLPPQRGGELTAVYRAADLVAVPSYNESFGLVALEAQACGTPVVAAAVGGLPYAVADGVSGRLVEGHDPGDWADVLASLLRRPEVLARLGEEAPAHAARFSWERTTESLLETYARTRSDFRGTSLPLSGVSA